MKVPTSQDNLWVAAGDGQLDRVRELIEVENVDINSHDNFGYTAMHAAVSYNQKEIVEYLLQKGANVDIEDFDKDTPLYVAETVDMAQYLLENGADPKHKNAEGISPALTAFEEGWTEVAEFLAGKTGEELPKEDEATEEALTHVESDDRMPADSGLSGSATATSNDNQVEESGELSEEMQGQLEEIMKKIEEEGGVQDEEELKEMVAKMLLNEMQRQNNQ